MNEATPRASQPNRLHIIYTAVALALAAVLLWYSLRGTDWLAVGHILRTARPPYVAASLAISTLTLFLRAMRWRLLLTAEAPTRLSTVFWATAAGYFGNSFLPARAGEFVRTYIISASGLLSKAYVLTTALSERLTDAITLVAISAVILLTVKDPPGWLNSAARPFALLGLFGIAAIAILPRFELLWRKLLHVAPLPKELKAIFDRILTQALLAIRSFHDPARLAQFVALTGAIWCLDAVSTVVLARAVSILISLPIAFLLLAGLGLGSALPSTPGYVGIYQFVAVNVLVPFGISRSAAIAYILLAQAFSYVSITFWGLLALSKFRGISWQTLKSPPSTT